MALERIASPERREKLVFVTFDRPAVLLERGDHGARSLFQVASAIQLQPEGQLENRLQALIEDGLYAQIGAEREHTVAEKVRVGLSRLLRLVVAAAESLDESPAGEPDLRGIGELQLGDGLLVDRVE